MADINKIKALKDQGKTHRQIAAELGISKSTVSNKLKFAQSQINPVQQQIVPQSSEPDPLQSVHFIPRMPPGNGEYSVPSLQQYTGIYRGGHNFYVPADIAIIESRENARRLYNNLSVREALQSRLWAVSEMAGHVEAEDNKNPLQAEVANQIQDVIENIPDFLKLKYCLLKSRFFGVYGVQLKYAWKQNKLSVKSWVPVHGDSIIFKQDSDDIGIYTTIGGGAGTKHVTSEPGYIGRAHVLEDGRTIYYDDKGLPYQKVGTNERQAFILMSYEYEPSDFLNPRQAGGIKGLGIRSVLYSTWYVSQEILGNIVDFCERYSSGITMYKFLRGNEASFNAARELAESASNNACVMVPVEPDVNGGKPLEGVERIEIPATGLDSLKSIWEEFNKQMRLFIVGQDSTSRQVHGGLGSKLSSVQENTFNRIVRFDCQDLAETLTRQLVSVLQEWNHPGTESFSCKYIIDADKPQAKEQLEAIELAYSIGVSFNEDEVRGITGMSKPTLDDIIIKNGPEMPTLPGLTPPPFGKPALPGMEEEKDNPFDSEEPEEKENPFAK